MEITLFVKVIVSKAFLMIHRFAFLAIAKSDVLMPA